MIELGKAIQLTVRFLYLRESLQERNEIIRSLQEQLDDCKSVMSVVKARYHEPRYRDSDKIEKCLIGSLKIYEKKYFLSEAGFSWRTFETNKDLFKPS